MPKIVRYEAQYAFNPPRGDIAGAGASGMALARQANAVSDQFADLADKQKVARQRAELADANMKGATALADLELELERDTDFATQPERFKQRSQELRQSIADGIQDGAVRGLFQQDFDKLALSKSVSVRRDAFKRENDDARAKLDANLDTYAELAGKSRNDQEYADIVTMARMEISNKAEAGYITREDAGKRERGFASKLDEVQVRKLMLADPEAAMNRLMSGEFAGLDETARTRLTETAIRKYDSRQAELGRQADRAERLAEKRLKAEGDALAKDGWDMLAGGNLSVEWIRENKAKLSETDFRSLMHAATTEDAKQDDVETVIDLRSRVDTDDISTDAARALREGKIRTGTYNSLVEKNRSAQRDDQPASPYKSSRDLIRQTLDPTNLVTGPAAQIAKSGMASALVDYDEWAIANPRATRQEHLDEARATIQRYQIVNYEQMSMSQGLPRYFKGARSEMSMERLDQAEAETMRQFDARAMSQSQATQELQRIENWRGILRAKPGAK